MIVDDSPLNLEILEEVCSNYTCESASSGEEALVAAAIFRPDIVLLDIMMPDINGYQVCQIMRENPLLNHAKIIMVSAKGMLNERLEGYEAGADDYVTKPFDEEELLAKIKVYTRLKSEEETSKFKKDAIKLLLLEANDALGNIRVPAASLIDTPTLDVQERGKLLEKIRKSTEDMEKLFDEVLSLSDLESGTWNNPLEAVDLCELVQESVDAVLPLASKHGVVIKHDFPEKAYSTAHREQLLRALGILLDNAIKFSPEDNTIAIRISDEDDGYNAIVIVDHGTGIELPLLEKEDLKNNTTTGNKRYYVHWPNLTIAQHIMQINSGSLEIKNNKEKGTTVTLRLPIQLVE